MKNEQQLQLSTGRPRIELTDYQAIKDYAEHLAEQAYTVEGFPVSVWLLDAVKNNKVDFLQWTSHKKQIITLISKFSDVVNNVRDKLLESQVMELDTRSSMVGRMVITDKKNSQAQKSDALPLTFLTELPSLDTVAKELKNKKIFRSLIKGTKSQKIVQLYGELLEHIQQDSSHSASRELLVEMDLWIEAWFATHTPADSRYRFMQNLSNLIKERLFYNLYLFPAIESYKELADESIEDKSGYLLYILSGRNKEKYANLVEPQIRAQQWLKERLEKNANETTILNNLLHLLHGVGLLLHKIKEGTSSYAKHLDFSTALLFSAARMFKLRATSAVSERMIKYLGLNGTTLPNNVQCVDVNQTPHSQYIRNTVDKSFYSQAVKNVVSYMLASPIGTTFITIKKEQGENIFYISHQLPKFVYSLPLIGVFFKRLQSKLEQVQITAEVRSDEMIHVESIPAQLDKIITQPPEEYSPEMLKSYFPSILQELKKSLFGENGKLRVPALLLSDRSKAILKIKEQFDDLLNNNYSQDSQLFTEKLEKLNESIDNWLLQYSHLDEKHKSMVTFSSQLKNVLFYSKEIEPMLRKYLSIAPENVKERQEFLLSWRGVGKSHKDVFPEKNLVALGSRLQIEKKELRLLSNNNEDEKLVKLTAKEAQIRFVDGLGGWIENTLGAINQLEQDATQEERVSAYHRSLFDFKTLINENISQLRLQTVK